VEIPAPKFEIFETVEPTQDAAIKHGGPGKVEHRAWVEYDQRPGYWRYTVRWPAQGTSSESDEHLQVADRLMCDLKVVVSGAPFKIETSTTATVGELVEQAILKAGAKVHPAIKWELRTEDGKQLTHLVGDAGLVDGETVLFLDPQVGGGGDDAPDGWQGTPPAEVGVSERGGVTMSDVVDSVIEEADRESREAAARPGIGDGWQGTPPAENTRWALIHDVLEAELSVRHIATGAALPLADAIELALLGSGDDEREADAQEAINAVGEALDRIDAPQGATYAERIDRLHRMLLDRIDQARYIPRPEGKVKPSTRELVIVLEDVSDADHPPEYRFIELEDQDGAGVGGFGIKPSSRTPFREITIPYGRDDAWVSEVAYQAAGAATRPLMEDHPDYVFPYERVGDAVAELLSDFGIARACRDCAEEEIEQGRKEVGDRRDATIKALRERCDQLLEQRESARSGEDHFKAQRDSALRLLRWLVGDLIPSHLVDLTGEDPS